MGLTSAMYTGLSGLNVNQFRIDTIGNNIANVNTTAFKGSRTIFQTQYSRLLTAGNGPNEFSGGVNPMQVGLGATIGATQKNMTQGSVETTGIASDMAIQGAGMFILARPDGQQVFTRDGSFSVDSANKLVSIDGNSVRGFGVDANFAIIPGTLTNLTIPLGTLTVARATTTVEMDGDLSASGTIATQGTILASQAFVDGGGGLATAGTALTDLRPATTPTSVAFTAGNTITVNGITRGGRTLPAQTFTIGQTGNTLGDFASWLQTVAGIQTGGGVPGNPGVTIENGQLVVRGNAGEANALTITANDITSNNPASALPFTFTETQSASGSGVFTSFTVYDSLGAPVNVQATFALESTPSTGPVWRFYLDAPDSNGVLQPVGTGTIAFDTRGNFVSATGNQFRIDRSGSGAASPQEITLDFSQLNGLSTVTSNIIMARQDGYPPGTLTNYSVGPDGTINGTFSNGLSRTLGQVALAVFPNPEAMIALSDNLYVAGPNTGTPTITSPGLLNAGTILGGALELSNVDLSSEFVGLITSSAGFQAASRVISTSSDMLDQLLLLAR